MDPLWYRCPEYHPLRVPELASQHGDCPPAGATRAGVSKTKRNGGLHWKGSPHSGSFRSLLPCVSAAGEVGVILGCGKLRSPSHRTAPLRQVSIPNSANSLGLLGNPSFPGSYPVPGSDGPTASIGSSPPRTRPIFAPRATQQLTSLRACHFQVFSGPAQCSFTIPFRRKLLRKLPHVWIRLRFSSLDCLGLAQKNLTEKVTLNFFEL